MTTRTSLFLTPIVTMLLAMPAYGQDAVTRHLVYDFTLGAQSDTHTMAAAGPQTQPVATPGRINDEIPTSKAVSDTESSGVSSDRGTIAVDVFSPQADGGLHVRVSESGSRNRTATPVDCIVYPSTSVDCTARISAASALVLSTLSPTFFQPSLLDAKNHWSVGTNTPNLSLDFTATARKDSVVWITEERNQKLSGSAGGTLHSSATFTYDTIKRLSTDVKERETIQQGETGQGSNVTLDISATLTSDSGTAKN